MKVSIYWFLFVARAGMVLSHKDINETNHLIRRVENKDPTIDQKWEPPDSPPDPPFGTETPFSAALVDKNSCERWHEEAIWPQWQSAQKFVTHAIMKTFDSKEKWKDSNLENHYQFKEENAG